MPLAMDTTSLFFVYLYILLSLLYLLSVLITRRGNVFPPSYPPPPGLALGEKYTPGISINLLKPTGHVMHQQFNI